MQFYEREHSGENRYLYHQFDRDLCFPLHLHRSFEFIYVEEGELRLRVNADRFAVRAGSAALIFPNQLHAYEAAVATRSYLCIFSCDYIYDFYAYVRGKTAENPTFPMKDASVVALLSTPGLNEFSVKAALYAIAGQFLSCCALRPTAQRDEPELLEKVISLVQEHFREPLSLRGIASRTGYQYNYLSAYLHRRLNLNFTELVNRYRVDYASDLLRQTRLPVTDIAERCGFNTIRSFNRNFLRLTGKTPQGCRGDIRRTPDGKETYFAPIFQQSLENAAKKNYKQISMARMDRK